MPVSNLYPIALSIFVVISSLVLHVTHKPTQEYQLSNYLFKHHPVSPLELPVTLDLKTAWLLRIRDCCTLMLPLTLRGSEPWCCSVSFDIKAGIRLQLSEFPDIVKLWSKRRSVLRSKPYQVADIVDLYRKINSPYHGTLSSYGYAMLVIFFLVHVKDPPVLPNLQQMPPMRPISPVRT